LVTLAASLEKKKDEGKRRNAKSMEQRAWGKVKGTRRKEQGTGLKDKGTSYLLTTEF
jgi:hypothetical protein